MRKLYLFISLIVILVSCSTKDSNNLLMDESKFVTTVNGKETALITLKNENNTYVQITNYGARVVSIIVKDKNNIPTDVAWGFESIDGYINANDINSGPIVGRYGNRIGKGLFSLDDKIYSLTINDGENHLHGGTNGFSTKVWDYTKGKSKVGEDNVTLSYLSKDGEEGYPGNLKICVIYTLKNDNSLDIEYSVTTDSKTIVNPTSHIYFNLHGDTKSSTNSHMLKIYASKYTPTDNGLIPTGEIVSLDGSPLDFRVSTKIGKRISSKDMAIEYGKGYDHNFVLDKEDGEYTLAAEVFEPSNGILMSVYTDQPGLQFYSGNFMNGSDTGKNGNKNEYRTGIALEAQNYPDAPNHPNFPSSVLEPGKIYTQRTSYKWTIK